MVNTHPLLRSITHIVSDCDVVEITGRRSRHSADINEAAVGAKGDGVAIVDSIRITVPSLGPTFGSSHRIISNGHDSRVRCAYWKSVVRPSRSDNCRAIRRDTDIVQTVIRAALPENTPTLSAIGQIVSGERPRGSRRVGIGRIQVNRSHTDESSVAAGGDRDRKIIWTLTRRTRWALHYRRPVLAVLNRRQTWPADRVGSCQHAESDCD